MNEELEGAEPAQTATPSSIYAFNADLEYSSGVFKQNLGVGGMTEFDLQHIKVPAGGGLAFDITDLDTQTSVPKLVGAILMVRDRRAYWPKSGDETPAGVPPQCHSNDGLVGVGDPGGNCKLCPLAQYLSAASGKGQACKATVEIFLFREGCDSILPDVLTLPPTSLKPFRTLCQRTAGASRYLTDIVIEVGLTREKNTVNGKPYSVATFRTLRTLTKAEKVASLALQKMFEPMLQAPPTIQLSAGRPQGNSGLLIETTAEPEQGAATDPAFE